MCAADRVGDLSDVEISTGIHAHPMRPNKLPWPFTLIRVPKLAHQLPLQIAQSALRADSKRGSSGSFPTTPYQG